MNKMIGISSDGFEKSVEEAFKSLCQRSGIKIRVVCREGAEITFGRDLLSFYSSHISEMIVSLSKSLTYSLAARHHRYVE